ncbi:MAG: hypothetical protein ACK4ZJ_18130, partial [Allorhizobium sp.]
CALMLLYLRDLPAAAKEFAVVATRSPGDRLVHEAHAVVLRALNMHEEALQVQSAQVQCSAFCALA